MFLRTVKGEESILDYIRTLAEILRPKVGIWKCV